MTAERFEAAANAAAARLSVTHLRTLADRIAAGWPDDATLQAVPVAGLDDVVRPLLAARRVDELTDAEAAAYLRGLAAGRAQQEAAVRVEAVWSGPHTHQIPVRDTAQVLVDLITSATGELLLMTYSAKPYPPVLEALSAAVARGVTVNLVVETLQGAGSALAGAEPAAAFTSVRGLGLWHWPVTRRGEAGGKMHAKIAIADRRSLLVSSANLTQSGVTRNIEAGLLIHGGTAPQRAAEHIAELMATGVLVPLRRE